MRLAPLPLPLLLLLLAGCSGDPAASRLRLGDEMIVRAPEPDPNRPPVPTFVDGAGEAIPVTVIEPNAVDMKPQGKLTTSIQAGSKARVIAADRPVDVRRAEKDYLADLDGAVDRRWVKVKILDGRNADEVGELPRNALRPAR